MILNISRQALSAEVPGRTGHGGNVCTLMSKHSCIGPTQTTQTSNMLVLNCTSYVSELDEVKHLQVNVNMYTIIPSDAGAVRTPLELRLRRASDSAQDVRLPRYQDSRTPRAKPLHSPAPEHLDLALEGAEGRKTRLRGVPSVCGLTLCASISHDTATGKQAAYLKTKVHEKYSTD